MKLFVLVAINIALHCGLLLTTACNKDKDMFQSSNDSYNKKYKKHRNEALPILNAVYLPIEYSDKISYYELQKEYYNDMVQINDSYFANVLSSPEGTDYKMAKIHEVTPYDNPYFINNLLLKNGTAYNDDKLKYFNYLQFLVQTKSNTQSKQTLEDPISNTFNPNSLSIMEANADVFNTVPVSDY